VLEYNESYLACDELQSICGSQASRHDAEIAVLVQSRHSSDVSGSEPKPSSFRVPRNTGANEAYIKEAHFDMFQGNSFLPLLYQSLSPDNRYPRLASVTAVRERQSLSAQTEVHLDDLDVPG